MSPSIIAFQSVIAIYVIKVTVAARSYENGLHIITEPQNNFNTNNTDRHYGSTSRNYTTNTASRSLIKSKLANNARKLLNNSILIPQINEMDFKDVHNISSSPPFQNDQKMAASLEFQQSNSNLFSHGENRHRPQGSSRRNNIQERKAFQSVEQPILVKLLLDKTKLISGHRPTTTSGNAMESVQIAPIVGLINYIAERYLYHCISVILYDDYYETQFHLLLALLSTYPLTYIHGKIGRQDLIDPPDMRCRDFLLFVRNLKTTENVLGRQSISRVVVVSQDTALRIREFLSSSSSQYLVNLLVIGNQNQVGHESSTSSNQNFKSPRLGSTPRHTD
jgi:hypothetical protein